jgi:hypothetical protein
MALKQVGNSNVYVLEVDSANLNKTNYATLVSDLRWKLWQEVKDEQARLQKLDLALYDNKVRDIEARRKALQTSKDKLSRGLKDAQDGAISFKDLVNLSKADAQLAGLAARLEYSEKGRMERAQAANDLKLALASAETTTLVDVIHPITGMPVTDSDGNILQKQIVKTGKEVQIETPVLTADGLYQLKPDGSVDTKKIAIPLKDAQALIEEAEKAKGEEKPARGAYAAGATARLDATAKTLGFKNLQDFIGGVDSAASKSKPIQDELSKLDDEIAKLQAPEYTGRTGSTQELRKAYSEQMGVGGMFGMEPRSSRAKPFFDEGDVLPNIERKISEKLDPWVRAENTYRASVGEPELTSGEIETQRAKLGASLGRKLESTESPYDRLPVAFPVDKGDFLKKDRAPYEATSSSKIDVGFSEAPSQTFDEAYGGASTAPVKKVSISQAPSRSGIMGQEIPPAASIPQVIETPPARFASDVDIYRSMFERATPVSQPMVSPTMPYGTRGTVPSSQVIEKPMGVLPDISETFAAPTSGVKGSPSIPYEPTPFSTTEQKMQMDAIKKKAEEMSKPKGSSATQQDRRAMYASNVVKKGIDLTEKPKKLERLAKLDLPEKERRKKVGEHILVADALFEANSGKDNAFKAAFDELSRVYKDEKDKRQEAQSYLVAKSILEQSIKKPV